MTRPEPLIRIPVGVVIERRKAKSPWADFVWRAVAVLPGVPDTAPWTELDGNAECTNLYGGAGEVALYRSDTSGYRNNLATGKALLWVVLRSTHRDPPYEISAVTADPSEGEAFTESANNLVETVAMPESIRRSLADFVAEHHVEHPFVKRKRDRASAEAMALRPTARDRK